MIAIWLTTSSENSTKKEKVHSSVKQLHKIKENKEINSHTARSKYLFDNPLERKSVRGEYFKSASPVRNTSPSKNLCTDESGRKTSYRLLRDVIMENEPKEGVATYAFEEKVRLRTASRFNNRQQDYLSILKEKSEVKRK